MKKLLLSFLLLPFIANATETGESCSKIEDKEKRLACYDSIFLISEPKKQDELSERMNAKLQELKEKLASWTYHENKDEMRNTVNYYATKLSENEVNFNFPYHGGSKAKITLRKHSEYGNDIIISISKGQFSCRYDSCSISAKFDDNKVEKYTVGESSSGSSDVLFISGQKNLKKFVSNLKKSKKVILELNFFDHGKEQFTFDIEGLDWKHF